MSTCLSVGAVLGRYRITGTLGHGGMGVVYAAVREDLGREVALKVLRADLAEQPEVRRRFRREASTLSRVYSPHIVDIYEYGEQDGCLFIATSLVSGGDLRRHLRERGGLSPVEALAIVAQVSSGLADAHAAGVVHRDIKPSNVLLRRSPEGGTFVYLCDLGIARNPDHEDTPIGGCSGTQAYMAPERHTGAPATVSSDIYSVGGVLFATLTGTPPYQGTDVQVAVQHLSAPVPQYRRTGEVADSLNAILRRSMAKDPGDRYASAADLHADLRRAKALAESLPGDTVVAVGAPATAREATLPAVPAGRDERGRRLGGRRRLEWASLTASAAAVLIAAGGAAFSSWSDGRAGCLGARALAAAECGPPGGVDTAPEERFTCWDGRPVARRTDCTDPAGLRGLSWVFPSLERDLDSCENVVDPTVDPSLRRWRCPVPAGADGEEDSDASVTYTEWLSAEAARSRLARTYGRPPVNFVVGGKPAGYRWWSTEPDDKGRLTMSVAYLLLPFSASVASTTSAGLDRACARVVARSPLTFIGDSLECGRPVRHPRHSP